jgi:hypothetical protein
MLPVHHMLLFSLYMLSALNYIQGLPIRQMVGQMASLQPDGLSMILIVKQRRKLQVKHVFSYLMDTIHITRWIFSHSLIITTLTF